MHEMMVAESLLRTISNEAVKRNLKPLGAKISCGTLYAINDEALCFAFEAIARDTPCEGVKLQIEHKPIRGQCKNCGETFDVKLDTPFAHTSKDKTPPSQPSCPKCACEQFDLLPDAPLLLEEIEFQTE